PAAPDCGSAGRRATLVAELDGGIVGGFVVAPVERSGNAVHGHGSLARPERSCYLAWAATRPEARGSGAGVALTQASSAGAGRARLPWPWTAFHARRRARRPHRGRLRGRTGRALGQRRPRPRQPRAAGAELLPRLGRDASRGPRVGRRRRADAGLLRVGPPRRLRHDGHRLARDEPARLPLLAGPR